ncbi:MAG: FAD-binding oxidoreductase [Roseivivax sp.]|nr:FAD-binding oxidoreductase [Roseivivax sp.]
MKRLYEAAAYEPPHACWWSDTVEPPHWPALAGDLATDVAVIGGGFTGLSAALHLAGSGVDVTVLEAETPGFGASGRNGGFCCLGGAKASRKALLRSYGTAGLAEWRATEVAAIATVDRLIARHGWDVDRHSHGETLLAHTPRAMAALRGSMPELRQDYGVEPELIEQGDLPARGLSGPFHGAVRLPLGFALNPRKYHSGLATAAAAAGARCLAQSAVRAILPEAGRWRLETARGAVTARRVILATNGYSSEDVPAWLRGRYLPVQSCVLVTRPLTEAEQIAQGWTSDQMAYDSRTLLHYFRKMPDGRFLFGMRGGIRATPGAEAAIQRRLTAHFHAMFPAWKEVEITHRWQGLVCLMPDLVPFCGPVPDMPGVFAGMGYHGNGVAMGSHTGAILADLAAGRPVEGPYPAAMRKAPGRFPLGMMRRALLWPAYAAAGILDL